MAQPDALERILPDAQATESCGAALAPYCYGAVIYLEGDLGAGKTTLSRGLLRALGISGAVKSPTFSIVEIYALPCVTVFHLDLYRLSDPEEVMYLGIEDQRGADDVLLIEWPDHGRGALPPADLIIELSHRGDRRLLRATAMTAKGGELLGAIRSASEPRSG